MVNKPHRTNSNFQIKYFIATAHTPDGKYMQLYELYITTEAKLKHAEAQKLEFEAKREKLEYLKKHSKKKYEIMEAEAELMKVNADLPIWIKNVEAAQQELAYIKKLMDELEPHRKYKDRDILEANELIQEEEWAWELITRAENYILSEGRIPADHFTTMRLHPHFSDMILPHIQSLISLTRNKSLIEINEILENKKLLSIQKPKEVLKCLNQKI
ncbi:MAG: hypothetical protein C0175_03725 [Caldisericum exile]|uniref:Uncharacterized protein n=1 Tax=Caldisericum exile TaxID=693075 RepID=A0A2J6X6D8_9BACT|nr:MAG: hypothetical protein C0175_03725 [Caldisericum exile]HEM55979.1 hypothetical protein [Thermodesulfobium narugense]